MAGWKTHRVWEGGGRDERDLAGGAAGDFSGQAQEEGRHRRLRRVASRMTPMEFFQQNPKKNTKCATSRKEFLLLFLKVRVLKLLNLDREFLDALQRHTRTLGILCPYAICKSFPFDSRNEGRGRPQ